MCWLIRIDNRWVTPLTAWRVSLTLWQMQLILSSQMWRELLGGHSAKW